MKMQLKLATLAFTALAAFGLQSSALGQGALIPPGPPGPTMKSLDQIASSGIAINAINTPGSGGYQFVISAPGNYFLSTNFFLSNSNLSCIDVTAPGVTIDLNGFRIVCTGGIGSNIGIMIEAAADSCFVKNGSIADFEIGFESAGIGGTASKLNVSGCAIGMYIGGGWTVDSCNVHNNPEGGISTSDGGCSIANCVVNHNGGDGIDTTGDGNSISHCVTDFNAGDGIYCFELPTIGNTISDCTASGNGVDGIFPSHGATVIRCNATYNGRNGIYSQSICNIRDCNASSQTNHGILTGVGCTISGCSASENHGCGVQTGDGCLLTQNNAGYNSQVGIQVGTSCSLSQNNANNNLLDGIQVVASCQIINNNASYNQRDGIRTTSVNNRIDSNTTMSNSGTGIHSTYSATADWIIRNLSYSNIQNYNPASGPFVGPVSVPNTATSPWADF
jgi:hypothetical protein